MLNISVSLPRQTLGGTRPGAYTMSEKAFPLAEATNGTKATVVALRGGSEFQGKVTSMGLFVGCRVEVLIGGSEGRMIVAVGDTRIALGHGMAEKVMVRGAAT